MDTINKYGKYLVVISSIASVLISLSAIGTFSVSSFLISTDINNINIRILERFASNVNLPKTSRVIIVYDQENSRPIKGAELTFTTSNLSIDDITNQDGVGILSIPVNLKEGSIRIRKKGFIPREVDIDLLESKHRSHIIFLEKNDNPLNQSTI